MKIELKNIKHAEFASEETHCYTASLYIDGKRVGTVGNDGHGGPDHFTAYKRSDDDDWGWTENRASYEKACEWLAETHYEGSDLHSFLMEYPAEAMGMRCGELVNEWLVERDIKRSLKKTICFIDPDREGIFEFKKVKPTKENVARAKDQHPTYIILNALPIAQAVRKWKAADQAA